MFSHKDIAQHAKKSDLKTIFKELSLSSVQFKMLNYVDASDTIRLCPLHSLECPNWTV